MAGPGTPYPIHVLLSEQEVAKQFADALASGYLPEPFFYWHPLSVEAWVNLCRSPEYRNADRALRLAGRIAPRLAALWPDSATLCSLGCGEGSKDRALLAGFRDRLLNYMGCDFSRPLLEMALAAVSQVSCSVRGVQCDIARDLPVVAAAVRELGGPAIYAVLGNTLGAFDPDRFPARLRKVMHSTDRALFDGEIFAGEETLRGYDHPVNQRFAFAPLAALGITEADGELHFELQPGSAGLHEVVKYFVSARDLALTVAGREVCLAQGRRLRMSSSLKYDQEALEERVARGGFRIELAEKSEDGRFLLLAAAPISKPSAEKH